MPDNRQLLSGVTANLFRLDQNAAATGSRPGANMQWFFLYRCLSVPYQFPTASTENRKVIAKDKYKERRKKTIIIYFNVLQEN
jgi:hypothetical protein